MPPTLDLELAKDNLNTEIAATRAKLAELEIAHAQVSKLAASELQSVLTLLTTYGRPPRAPRGSKANGNGNGHVVAFTPDPDKPMTQNIVAFINVAGTPQRAEDVHAALSTAGIQINVDRVAQILAEMTATGRIRRFATGVYGPLNAKTEHQAPSNGGPVKKLARAEYFALLEATIDKVFAAHKHSGEAPLAMPEVTTRVTAAGFPWKKGIKDRQLAVARVVRKAKLKHHGSGPHRTYSL